MSNKYSDNKLVTEFSQKIFADLSVYPYMLIRDYQVLGINEKQLVILLRILRPYFHQGELNLLDVAEEFAVSEDEARVLILPFLERRLLEIVKSSGQITCNGMLNSFYESWISQKRKGRRRKDAKERAYSGMSPESRELIRNLTKLFHAFEQELGKNLTPMQSEEIRSWLEIDQMSPELIEEALKRAVLQEKCTFAYIKSILRRWREAGYNTLTEVMEKDQKPSAAAKTKPEAKRQSVYGGIYDKY